MTLLDDGLNVSGAAPAWATASEADYESMTVPELKDLAEARQVEVTSRARKPEIIDALRTAEGAG